MKRLTSKLGATNQDPILNEKISPLQRNFNRLRQMRGAPTISHYNEGGHEMPIEPIQMPVHLTQQESNMERFRGELADKIRSYVNQATGMEGHGDRSLVGGLDDILRGFAHQ